VASDRAFLFSSNRSGIKLGLEQIRALLVALRRPDLAYPSITIAGTNGKGSVTAMVERGLREAGRRTGRYTSPHLVHLEERIAIDGQPIAASALDRSLARVRDGKHVAAITAEFLRGHDGSGARRVRESAVDVAVLEVGLGGRLDATNAVTPIAAAITAIAFDHEEYLGRTIEAIRG
jgi:dihydrofolate synthase/folylpolyglutamate synthase